MLTFIFDSVLFENLINIKIIYYLVNQNYNKFLYLFDILPKQKTLRQIEIIFPDKLCNDNFFGYLINLKNKGKNMNWS